MSLKRTPLLIEADSAIQDKVRTYHSDPTPENRRRATRERERSGDKKGAEDVRFGPEAKAYTRSQHAVLRSRRLSDTRRASAQALKPHTPEQLRSSSRIPKALEIEQGSREGMGRSAKKLWDRRAEEIKARTGRTTKTGMTSQFITRMIKREHLPPGEQGDQDHRHLLAKAHGFRKSEEGGYGEGFSFHHDGHELTKNPTSGLERSLRRGGHLDTHDMKVRSEKDQPISYDPDEDYFGEGPPPEPAGRTIHVQLTPKKRKRRS